MLNKGRFKKGCTPWHKGKTGVYSSETLKKISGKKAHRWKGGRWINAHGYIIVHSPNHHSVKKHRYALEHRLVMEKHLNRHLNSREIVHHLNGVKHDNRIENLVLCERRTHNLFIKKLQERICNLEKKGR